LEKINLKFWKRKLNKSNKNPVESLSIRMDKIEDRIQGFEDKVDV
jgi:hypothetical protein